MVGYHRSRIFAVLVLSPFILSLSLAQTPDTLQIEQAIKLAVENYPTVAQAEQNILAAKSRIDQSHSSFYPDVKAEGLYSRIGPVPEITMPGGSVFQMAPADNYNLHVTVRETAYDFGRRAAGDELARIGKDAAEIGLESAKYGLAYRVVDTFYAILLIRRNIEVLDEQIAALNQHLDITQKKVQTGTATDFDVLTTNVRIAAIQSRRIDQNNLLLKQENLLRQWTSIPQDHPIILKGDFDSPSASLDADAWINVALSGLPEVQLSKTAETSAEMKVRLSALGMKPILNLMLDGGIKDGYPDDLTEPKANWIGGVQVVVPIFNGHLTSYQKQEAMASSKAAQKHTQEIEWQVRTSILMAMADVRASQEKILTCEPQVVQARQAVVLAEARYKSGVATNLDLLDTQTALSEAELMQVKAQYELKMSYYNLRKAAGEKIW
jgi:outer membrane protein